MSDKTFRQTVEEILSSTECEHDGRICSDMTLDKYEERPSCEQCRNDRICEAVLKMAEGMPKRPTILIHTSNDRFVVPTLETRKQLQQIEDAEKEYLSECQAYWQGQIKE